MPKETEEKLAYSLTAETTELLPFLPYLLQDFWELGSNPDAVVELINKRASLPENARILDLACGKGAVSVKLAHKLGVKVKGIDLTSDFIEYAAQKAREFSVDDLCEFSVDDINEAVKKEKGYDCVVFLAAGNILGNLAETLNKLKAIVKQDGYLLLDNYDYITEKQWTVLFKETGLELIGTISDDKPDSDSEMAAITMRANELMEKHPDKKVLFEGYIRSQQNEYNFIENSLDSVTWILKNKKTAP